VAPPPPSPTEEEPSASTKQGLEIPQIRDSDSDQTVPREEGDSEKDSEEDYEEEDGQDNEERGGKQDEGQEDEVGHATPESETDAGSDGNQQVRQSNDAGAAHTHVIWNKASFWRHYKKRRKEGHPSRLYVK